MRKIVVVHTKSELEQAIQRGNGLIAIQNKKLAEEIKSIKNVPLSVLLAALAVIGFSTTNFWNPVGWGSGIVGFAYSGSLVSTLIALGLSISIVLAIYNNYSLKAYSDIQLSNGDKLSAYLLLEKN